MDPVKEAFQKVKEDIAFLKSELESIKRTLNQNTTQQSNQQTNQHTTPTVNNVQTPFPTKDLALEAQKSKISNISKGNEGVPTNQPTNQQTNQHPMISIGNLLIPDKSQQIPQNNVELTNLQRVSEILESLDELKKEVRLKFKRLTEQEMSVFSTIYLLEEQGFTVDYSLLAQKLNLSEISIRDYVRKILKKQVPLNKMKEDNKKIILSVPKDLKKIASLNTIVQLRNL